MTGARPKKTAGSDIRVGVSVDQVAAQHVGDVTAQLEETLRNLETLTAATLQLFCCGRRRTDEEVSPGEPAALALGYEHRLGVRGGRLRSRRRQDAAVERPDQPGNAGDEASVIVNVAGESVEDYVTVARKLDGQPGVAGIELNISCPNVGKGGLQFALDADAAGAVTAAVRAATELPLMVKLSPAAPDVRAIARAIANAGADSISAVNTLSGMAIDRARRRPLLGNTYGGLSGPALKPVALRVVYEVAQAVRIPIVAIGGIGALDDVLDFLMAGAVAVQVGTAVFADPTLPVRLVDELAAWCSTNGLASHRDLVGAALPSRRDKPSTKGVEYRP